MSTARDTYRWGWRAGPPCVEDVLRQALAGYLGRDPVDTIPERDHRGHLLWLHRSGTRGAGQ